MSTITFSTDAKYLYEIATAVHSGTCSTDLANRVPGKVHHARWLTKACRTLRLYIATPKPSEALTALATYIMHVYVPMYFGLKYRPSCTQGSIHFFNLIKYSEILPAYSEVVKKCCERNSYFAHSENVLLAMIFDNDPEIRRMGFRKILESRDSNLDTEYGQVRDYIAPTIKLNCNYYYEMIDWDFPYTEPPFTLTWSYEEIKLLEETGGTIENDVVNIPCHIQETERHIKIVTEASKAVGTQQRRTGVVLTTMKSREKRPKTETKSDMV